MINDADLQAKLVEIAGMKQRGPVKKSGLKMSATICGVTALIDEWAEASGLDPTTIYSRVKAGKTEKDLLAPVKPRKQIVAFGTSKTLYEWAAHSGINAATIDARLHSGVSPERAVTESVKPREYHGNTRTAAYRRWVHIRQRCENPKDAGFCDYGGRGIKVCQRWRDSFVAFLEDVGEPPSVDHSIDRIDNDGHYEPGNVRWATASVQQRNTRRSKLVTIDGVTKTLTEWVEESDIEYGVALYRINAGWEPRRALTEPPRVFSTRQD